MKFNGIMPALVTPLNADESVNVTVLEGLIEGLLAEGAEGFYVGGATGEGLALRVGERKILAEAAIATTRGRVPSIVQVASTDLSAAIELAKHAESVGAAAVSATPPLFFQYDEDDVYNYYKTLADAVHIPLMIYYNPGAGFAMNAKFAARMFEVDNVTAIKWTSSDYFQMMMVKELTHGEMNVINGPDEMLLMGLAAGADGGIGTTYNFMLEIIRNIYDNFTRGAINEAREWQYKAARIITELKKFPTIPATKAILTAMGIDVGLSTAPMKRLTGEETERLLKLVSGAGLDLSKKTFRK